jgi:hypothetical protein
MRGQVKPLKKRRGFWSFQVVVVNDSGCAFGHGDPNSRLRRGINDGPSLVEEGHHTSGD